MADRVEGVVAVVPRDGKWLVTRRAAHIALGGWWCFPGGAIEAGEQPAEAVVREVREEVGLSVMAEREIWQWEDPGQELVLYWWLTRLAGRGAEIRPNPDEVAEARWVHPTDFLGLKPLLESNTLFLRESSFAAAYLT